MFTPEMTETSPSAWQAAFAAALMEPRALVPREVWAQSDAQRETRFNVYRNNVHASLSAAVAARFPVVARLVGDEFFRAMALVFIDRHPPRSPVLAEYGDEFPAFLEAFEPVAALPYLPDVARLEWLRNRAYHAADEEALEISALASIDAEKLWDTRLLLHSAAGCVLSGHAIVSIWATNTLDESVKEVAIDVAEAALVTRPGLEVLVTPLSAAAGVLVDALGRGLSLGDAVPTAQSAGALDLSQALAALFQAGAVAGVHAPTCRSANDGASHDQSR